MVTKEYVHFSSYRNCFAYISKTKFWRFDRNKPSGIKTLAAHTAGPDSEEFLIGNNHAVPLFYPDHDLFWRPTVEALCSSQPAIAVPSAANYNLPLVDHRRSFVTDVLV